MYILPTYVFFDSRVDAIQILIQLYAFVIGG